MSTSKTKHTTEKNDITGHWACQLA